MTFKSVTLLAGAWLMPFVFLVVLGVVLFVGWLLACSLETVFVTYCVGWLIGYISNSFAEYYLKS